MDLPEDLRGALGQIKYGPHVSTAFLTNETSARPWDDIYAIAAPKRSFAIALNQASIVRGTESVRKPGGSFMTFSPASLGRALLEKSDEEVIQTHLTDLDQVLGHGFADSVVEAETDRWAVASPYSFPGRAKLQSTLMRGTDRVFLAGDYLGTLYTESSITTGFSAAQEAASLLATHRQAPPRSGLSIVVRLLMGIAIGAEYAVGWPLAEFSPTHLRGRLMAAMGIAWYGGFMIAFLIGHLLNEYTDLSWHFILGTSTFIAVALFLGRLGMPESPRWLWSVGRKDEARALAYKYMPDDALDDVQHEDVRKGSFGMLFSKEYWRSTLFISGFWFCAVTPYFAIATFADSVLEQYGLAGGLAGGVGLSAVALAGVVITFLLIEKAGRRTLTVPPQWLCAVVLGIIGLWAGAPAPVVLVLFLVFSFFNAGYNTLTNVYPGEVLPTEIRERVSRPPSAGSGQESASSSSRCPWSPSGPARPC
ncbi:MFS family permease [Arthrobacter globiformis]|nr:MFS family permease [Arthrobacter globiformis]